MKSHILYLIFFLLPISCPGSTISRIAVSVSNGNDAALSLDEFDFEVSQLKSREANALRKAHSHAPHLTEDKELKKLFLKACQNDPRAAAEQYAGYWANRIKLFQDKAFDEMDIEGALRDDKEALSFGHIRTVPENDQALIMDLSRLPKKYDSDSVARATMHLMMEAIRRSKRMQDNGMLFIVEIGNYKDFDINRFTSSVSITKYFHAFPARVASYCLSGLPASSISWIKRFFFPFLREEQKRVFRLASNTEEFQQCIGVDQFRS